MLAPKQQIHAPQVLNDKDLYFAWPEGLKALRRLVESSWAPTNFVTKQRLLAATVTQVLSKFGQNGAAALAQKRLAIDKGLKGNRRRRDALRLLRC